MPNKELKRIRFTACLMQVNGKPALALRKHFMRTEEIKEIVNGIIQGKNKFCFEGEVEFLHTYSAIDKLQKAGLLEVKRP